LTTKDTIDSRSRSRLPRISMPGSPRQASTARAGSAPRLADRLDPDGLLELEDQAGPDRLDDRRRAALLAMGRVGEEACSSGLT
jgi:hypothetical protein